MTERETITVNDWVVRCCGPLVNATLSEVGVNDLAKIFSALSDPARLRMLLTLSSRRPEVTGLQPNGAWAKPCELEVATRRHRSTTIQYLPVIN